MLMFYAELIIQEVCDTHHQTRTESTSIVVESRYSTCQIQ